MCFLEIYNFPYKVTNDIVVVLQPYRNFLNYAIKALVITWFVFSFLRKIIISVIRGYLKDFLESVHLGVDVFLVMFFLIIFIIAYFIVDFRNRWQKVDLDNPVFQKKYHTISPNVVEARNLLTHSFMEKIINFSEKYWENRKYDFSFNEDEMVIKYNFLKSKKKHNIFTAYKKWVNEDLFLDLYYELENMKNVHNELFSNLEKKHNI
jgi:hypothetical protein